MPIYMYLMYAPLCAVNHGTKLKPSHLPCKNGMEWRDLCEACTGPALCTSSPA